MSIVITFKGIAKYFHNFLNSMKFFFCAEVIHNYSKLPCNAVLLHTPMAGNQESLLFCVSIECSIKNALKRKFLSACCYRYDFSLRMYAKLKYQH